MDKNDNIRKDNDQFDRELRHTIKAVFSNWDLSRSVSDRVFQQIEEEKDKKPRRMFLEIWKKFGAKFRNK